MVEWLEQGRSIVWGQLLHLRTPVETLYNEDPTLVEELKQVSKALEQASVQKDYSQHHSDLKHPQMSLEQSAQYHHRLAEKWEVLVGRVRDISGFEDFLQPKRFTELLSAAKNGPVVVINVHKDSCDALVLVPDSNDVKHIPLHYFSYEKAKYLHQSLNQLLSNAGIRLRDARAMRRVKTSKEEGFESILSALWSCVVQPVVNYLALSVSFDFNLVIIALLIYV